MLVFGEKGKPEYPGKNPRCRVEDQQTQPTYDVRSGNRTRATLLPIKLPITKRKQPNSSLQLLKYAFMKYDVIVQRTVAINICRWHFIRSSCYEFYQIQLFTSTDLCTCVFGVTKILIVSLLAPSCSKGGYSAIHWINQWVLVVFVRWIAQSILWTTASQDWESRGRSISP